MENNKMTEIFGDIIVGADGAFSTVRKAMQQTRLFSFSQTYIDHGYIQMTIEAKAGKFMSPNHLHVWPRKDFMLAALPNFDGSWTMSLFMPFKRFESLDCSGKVLDFFKTYFSDSVQLLGEKQFKDFFKTKPSTLVSIKCSSFHVGENVLIIGDAAHAMVPFYGQGMNAGFEDCLLFDLILGSCNDNLPIALKVFTEMRLDDAHAICDLALYNYVEIRDLIMRPSYLIRKKLDDFLYKLLPNVWMPLFNSVVLSEMNYQQCIKNREWQDKVLQCVAIGSGVFITAIVVHNFCNYYSILF